MIKPLKNPWMENCLGCTKYKTVKEMNKKCESKKERRRIIKRQIYKLKREGGGNEG